MAAIVSFDINREFFVLDSDNLFETRTHLYGFALVNSIPVTTAEELGDAELTGDGAYVRVSRHTDRITVEQDYVGAYGLYLYREGDYFALSNSFFRLVEHVKRDHKITLNRDFATAFIPADLCSISFSETLVNEIRLLERNIKIEIPLDTTIPEFSSIDYRENTLEISSAEGIRLLDQWYEKWTAMIRNLASQTSNIQVDLSGGFDSRLMIGLFLGAGIDMNKIFVYSIKDDLHTHVEDYEIASAIADHYGFSLNNRNCLANGQRYYTLQEVLDISFYLKLGFHKQMHYRIHCLEMPKHCFGGSGGECVRAYWNMSEADYIENEVERCRNSYSMTAPAYTEAVRRNLQKTFGELRAKFIALGRPVPEEDLALNLYRETRCRNHFGKDVLENLFGNTYKYSPLLDPQLHRLKLNDSRCRDKNLLTALIFARYNPDLLEFKFEGGRSIAPETIAYAKQLSERFPYYPSAHTLAASDCTVRTAFRIPPAGNPRTTMPETNAAVKEIFHSRRIRGAFTFEYDPAIYDSVRQNVEVRTFHPLQDALAVIAISKVIQDCEAGENLRSKSLSEHMCLDLTPFPQTVERFRFIKRVIRFIKRRVAKLVCR